MIQFRPVATGALDVARYILIAAERQGTQVDALLLQQLLFACQGWSLADRSRPLFADALEAWPMGPTAHAVYREYEPFGMSPLPAGVEPALPEEDRALIEEVVLACVGGGEAARSTASQGEAWRDARRNLPPARPSRRKLRLEAIQEEFSRRAGDACAAIEQRIASLTRAGTHNARLMLGKSPTPDA